MNTNVGDISGNYYLSDKRKEMNNVYSEINGQTTLRARKYRFIFYIVIAISIIIGYASYTSKLSIVDQFDALKNYIPLGWWTNWWIITIVVIVFILSSFGWDMKGNILMVVNSRPKLKKRFRKCLIKGSISLISTSFSILKNRW